MNSNISTFGQGGGAFVYPFNQFQWNPGLGTSISFDDYYTEINAALGNGLDHNNLRPISAVMNRTLPFYVGGAHDLDEAKPVNLTGGILQVKQLCPPNGPAYNFGPLTNPSLPASYAGYADWIHNFSVP